MYFFNFDQQKQAGDGHTFISANTPRDSLPSILQERNRGGQRYFMYMVPANQFQFTQQGNSKEDQMFRPFLPDSVGSADSY